MFAMVLAALLPPPPVADSAQVPKVIGFDCRDEFKVATYRLNVDLTDHLWQDQNGSWYKIGAEAADALTLADWTSDNGSHRKLTLNRFKLTLSDNKYVAPVNAFVSQNYICRIVPTIDMTAGHKF